MNSDHFTPSDRKSVLHAEITWYEQRLIELGNGGESAYEKALAQSFEAALASHRTRLASIDC